MIDEQPFLKTILANPHDWSPRLVFADWLDECGDPRGELVRLVYWLHQPENVGYPPPPGRREREARLQELVSQDVPWIGPFVTIWPHIKLILIPPGTFMMGSPPDEEGRKENEDLHVVTHCRAFLLGVFPVTRSQWWMIMHSNPTYFRGKKFPVEGVSWTDCQEFCRRLPNWTNRTAQLPSEAEWEFACRAGTSTPFHFGAVLDGTQANCRGTYPVGTTSKRQPLRSSTRVGSYPPNAFGLYDMHGNVDEWCEDSAQWSEWNERMPMRARRGGSCISSRSSCYRAADRSCGRSDRGVMKTGFRVCIRLE